MSLEEPLTLRTIQELRTADAPQLYRPHKPAPSKAYDPEGAPHPNCTLCGNCSRCGTKTGKPNAHYQLCETCAPVVHEQTAAHQAAVLSSRAVEIQSPRASRRGTGTPRPHKRGPRTPLDVDAILEAYTFGQTINSIATALRVEHYHVRNIVLAAGIELRDDSSRGGRPRTGKPRRVSVPRTQLDAQAIITAYQAGVTGPTLAREHSCSPRRIRELLTRHGIPLRDDRATASGGKRIERDPAFLDDIRRLYLDEHLSQSQVAARLGTTTKVIQTTMARYEMPTRHGETGRMDGAAPLKARIAELGVPTSEIKAWGLHHGLLLEISPGIPPARVVNAYIDAHRQDGAA